MIKKGFIKRNKSNLYIIIIIILAGIAAAIYFGLLKRGERVVHSIQADEVESIYLYSYTGGAPPDNTSEHEFNEEEIRRFVALLHKTKLLPTTSNSVSNGAYSHYDIKLKDGTDISISPGQFFDINDKKYRLMNERAVWREYVNFNSLE